VLHAGGKFGGGGYKVSGGLHGVGASVVNALSEWLEVEVSRDGHIYQMKFSRGDITQEMRVIGTTDGHGTKVTFKPDPEMFDTLEYDYETLHTRMREQAFLNAGLKITITDARADERPGRTAATPCATRAASASSSAGYNRTRRRCTRTSIYMSGRRATPRPRWPCSTTTATTRRSLSFANNIHTPEGGMHEEGFKRRSRACSTTTGSSHGLLKGDDKNLSGEDVREGLTCDHLRQADGGAVRGPDEGQARQRLHAHARETAW
jgi:DNA gyrase subunit B